MLASQSYTSRCKQFQLGVLGFTSIEQALIANICKLTQVRMNRGNEVSCRFKIADINSDQPFDILLIDVDTVDTAQIQQWVKSGQSKATLLLIGKTVQANHYNGHYTLPRSRLGGLLLRQLDKIAATFIEHQTAAAKKSKHCLVIDDSQLVRAQMALILSEYDATAEFAEDAETGLRMAQKESYDLIFLDIMLPEMDGYQACKLLKDDPRTNSMPVVMLTSKRSSFNRMRGALVGCDKYLVKPIDPEQVQQVLQRFGSAQNFPEFCKPSMLTA